MIHFLSRAACAFVVVASCSSSALAGEPRKGLEHAVDDDTLIYGSLDVDRLIVTGKSLHLAQLWADEEMQAFLAPVLGPADSMGSVRIAKAIATLTHGYGVPDVIAGRVSFAVCGTGMIGEDGKPTWFDAKHPPSAALSVAPGTLLYPDLVVTVESSGKAACEASIARVLELEPDIVSTKTTIGGFAATETVVPMLVAKDGSTGRNISLFHGFAGDLFIATTRVERFERMMRSAQQGGEAPQQPLASHAAFQNYRNEIVRDGAVAELFVNVPGVLATAMPLAAAFDLEVGGAIPAMQQSGARGFGLAIAFEDGRIRQSVGMLVTSASMIGGMARMFARPGVLERASPIEGSTFALCVGVDWEAVVNAAQMGDAAEVDAALDEASTMLGFDVRDDLLTALGDTLTVKATMPEHAILPIPEWTVDLTLRDPEAVKTMLATVRPKLAKLSQGMASPTALAIDGHPEAFVLSLAAMSSPISPAVAVDGARLVVASSALTLRRTLAEPKTPRAAGDFANSGTTTFGPGGKDVCFVMYVDLATVAQRSLPLLQNFAPSITKETGIPLRLDELPLDVLVEHLSGALSTVRLSNQAIVLDESSPFGSQLALGATIGANLAANNGTSTAFGVDFDGDELEPLAVGAAPQSSDAFIGVQTEFAVDSSDGVPVVGVTEGGPAALVGLRAGDRLLAFDDHKVLSQADIFKFLGMRQPHESITVAYSRDGAVREVIVTLAKRGDFVNADGTKRQRP